MHDLLRHDDRPLFGRSRSNIRIHHMALIALLGWIGYLLFMRAFI